MHNRHDDKIRKTTDYDLFEFNDLNRVLHGRKTDPRALKRQEKLIAKMQRYGFMPSRAIQVARIPGSRKLKVIAGHNRLAAAKKLGIPVYYIVDESCVNLPELEDQPGTSWSLFDFATSHANAGHKDILRMLDFQRKHGLTMHSAIALMVGRSAGSATDGSVVDAVKYGTYQCGDTSHAEAVVRVTDAARDLKMPFATHQSFVSAVSACHRVDAFDASWLIHKMRKYPANIRPRTTSPQYLDEIEALYNYDSKPSRRLNLAFLAREAMRKRQGTFGGNRGGARKARVPAGAAAS